MARLVPGVDLELQVDEVGQRVDEARRGEVVADLAPLPGRPHQWTDRGKQGRCTSKRPGENLDCKNCSSGRDDRLLVGKAKLL